LTLEPPQTGSTSGNTRELSHKPSAISHGRGRARSQATAPSWWTARAREGEVKPGFSKEAILRPATENPRVPGGVFERVGALLSELVEN